jgi:hypothetical protein
MSDVNIGTENPFTVTLVEKWLASKELVDTLDEKMALESFGRTKLLNTRFEAANPDMTDKKANNPVATSIRNALSAEGLSDEQFAGLYETVRRVLKEYDKRLDTFVDANITKVDESDKPKEAELVEFRKERKIHVDNMNGIRNLLEGTDPDWFKAVGVSILGKEKIDNLRGAVGDRAKTGKRLGGTFQFTVTDPEGTETAITERKLSAVQTHLKKFVKNVGELWKAIEEQNPNFDRANPPDRFEFTVSGHKIVANKMTDETSDDDDESTEDINELTLDLSDDDPADFEADSDDNVTELFDDDDS